MVRFNDSIKGRSLQAVRVLEGLGHVRAAYVFGSQVEGTAHLDSDIDIAAFMDGVENWDVRRRADAVVRVQKRVGWDIEMHLFPASSHDHPPRASFAQHILQHGSRLNLDADTPAA